MAGAYLSRALSGRSAMPQQPSHRGGAGLSKLRVLCKEDETYAVHTHLY